MKLKIFIFVFYFLFLSQSQGDDLTLYFYHSPTGLNWHAPRLALTKTLENYFSGKPHPIGHVHVQLSCEIERNSFWQVSAGMTTADNDEEYNLIMEKKLGFGVMFHDFLGKLEDSKAVLKEIDEATKDTDEYKINFLKVKISKENCLRLKTYYEEYKAQEIWNVYGLYQRPRYKEGAGCTAFGVSFLELAGLQKFIPVNEWMEKLRVPHHLIGEQFEVSIWDILFSRMGRRWAGPGERGRDIEFYNADKMYEWVDYLWTYRDEIEPFKRTFQNDAKGLTIDLSEVPAPTESIWLE